MKNNKTNIKKHYYNYIKSGYYTHALLFELKRTNSPDYVQKLLTHFCNFVNRDYLGPRWAAKSDQFISMFAVPERLDLNFHYHAVIAIPDEYRERFEVVAPAFWKQIGSKYCNDWRPVCGKYDQKQLLTRTDQKDFIWYMFKHFDPNSTDWFISPHFRPVSAKELRKRRPARRPSGQRSKPSKWDYYFGPIGEPVRDI